VIASDDYSRNRSLLLSRVVSSGNEATMIMISMVIRSRWAIHPHLLVELSQLSVLLRDRHTLQVLIIPDSLKVPTDQQQVDLVVVFGF
jgi:hypothetical protein